MTPKKYNTLYYAGELKLGNSEIDHGQNFYYTLVIKNYLIIGILAKGNKIIWQNSLYGATIGKTPKIQVLFAIIIIQTILCIQAPFEPKINFFLYLYLFYF